MIEVEGLTKRYGSLTAVANLSFQIGPGQIVGLLGPNGAGKTTTLRIITGDLSPTSGEVRVAGHEIRTERREAQKKIGYLPENPPLYPELTVEESLRFAAGLRGHHSFSLEEVLVRSGLQEVRKRLIGNLSKGFRQRVGLAQAILHQPEVWILDEPTIGLDPKQIVETRELIRSLSHGKVVLLSSHILQEIANLCDRVLIIHQGQIVADRLTPALPELEALFLDVVSP